MRCFDPYRSHCRSRANAIEDGDVSGCLYGSVPALSSAEHVSGGHFTRGVHWHGLWFQRLPKGVGPLRNKQRRLATTLPVDSRYPQFASLRTTLLQSEGARLRDGKLWGEVRLAK